MEAEYSESSSVETEQQPSIDEAPSSFDHWIEEEETQEAEAHFEQVSSNLFSPEEFHSIFCVSFCTASHVTGLTSLAVDKSDGGAVACTRALYDTILEIPALHFLLSPNNKWFERAFAIGAFTIPMSAGVSAELKARKKSKKKPTAEAKDNDLNNYVSLREAAENQEG